MADHSSLDEWFVRGEDGCLPTGTPAHSVIYHPILNVILLVAKDNSVLVVDVISGAILQQSNLCARDVHKVKIQYLSQQERVLFCDGFTVGARKQQNGILLLDTALQTSVDKMEDEVTLEISLPEATHLFKILMSSELPGVDYVEDVLRELEKELDVVQQNAQTNPKKAKWASVVLKLPHCALKSVCSSLVLELQRLHQHVPGLPIVSALNDRLSYLLNSPQLDVSGGSVERALMYSEAARRHTFNKWPHMNYKWALPDSMAQAGFYHQPSVSGDDRAMCFTCNVCLVCWEPTDEPWSEHERHSPSCPYVKGEYTQNVPMAVTYASEPAHYHGGQEDKIEVVSTTTSKHYIATSGLHGDIVLWNMSKQLKKQFSFNIDPWDLVIMLKTGSRFIHCDNTDGIPPHKVKQTWVEPETSTSKISEELPCPASTSNCIIVDPDIFSSDSSDSDLSLGSDVMDSVEVKSGDKHHGTLNVGPATNMNGNEPVEIALEMETNSHTSQSTGDRTRSRPSPDVLVSALSVLDYPGAANSVNNDVNSNTSITDTGQAFMISGVAIRRNIISAQDAASMYSKCRLADVGSEVSTMNQVNQALSDDSSPQIIDQDQPACHAPVLHPFVSYLLVHDVRRSCKISNTKHSSTPTSSLTSSTTNSHPVSSSFGPYKVFAQDCYLPQILEMEESLMDVKEFTVGADSSIETYPTVVPGSTKLPVSVPVPLPLLPPPVSMGKTAAVVSPGSTGKSKTVISSEGSSNNNGTIDSSYVIADAKYRRPGQVTQCLELPPEVTNSQIISTIVPTSNSKYIVVITTPRSDSDSAETSASDMDDQPTDNTGTTHDTSTTSDTSTTDMTSSSVTNGTAQSPGHSSNEESYSAVHGCVLVYKISAQTSPTDMVCIEDTPVAIHVAHSLEETVKSVSFLPCDATQVIDEEESSSDRASTSASDSQSSSSDLDLQVAAVLYSGELAIIRLSDLKFLSRISPPEDDKFVSATFCSGADSLCACTDSGKLHFYAVGPCRRAESDTSRYTTGGNVIKDSMGDDSLEAGSDQMHRDDMLAYQDLTIETLQQMYELTQFEALVPRFTATVPPCWTEIQQEQQQRRHPQHLQQQGEATQHTRTWKLQHDNVSFGEHMIELVLPKACNIGHIDLKFSLHPLCSAPPNIQVTLLKQSTKKIVYSNSMVTQVDAPVNFHLPASVDKPAALTDVPNDGLMKHDGYEVLCGPVDLSNNVDLSGHSGVLTLSSPQLLSTKARSFLLQLKPTITDAEKIVSEQPSSGKQKLDSIRGCDWIQELSITVRKSKKTSISRDRLQRNALLETTHLHEHLISVICGESKVPSTTSMEHRQSLALDILLWIMSIQKNDPNNRGEQLNVVKILRDQMKPFLQACLIDGTRSLAHKCARIIILSIEYAKTVLDLDIPASLSVCILDSLLHLLPKICTAQSAGALHWFFILLNQVKFMDASQTGHRCVELLIQVAQQYHSRVHPLHSLLKSRFGLYGTPLDPILFDIETSLVHRSSNNSASATMGGAPSGQAASGPTSYASALQSNNNLPPGYVASTINNNNATPSAGHSMPSSMCDDQDFRDLISINSQDKSNTKTDMHTNKYICGLLEVEPLHFICHATSDGTRVERMDAGGNPGLTGGSPSGLSGTINFGDALPPVSAHGAALASLSSAMASAEQQLVMLQHKQQQLLKLQQQKQKLEQKLAETSKGVQVSTSVSYVPYNIELMPPTPKTTPLFMTPPVTPPNESYSQLFNQSGEPTSWKVGGQVASQAIPTKVSSGKADGTAHKPVSSAHMQYLLQPPPPQVLVIERMHSGARRFVVLDFGRSTLLTDVVIPACTDLASLSIDVWVHGEEIDGQRLVVSSDIGMRSLILSDLLPPPVCRYVKITTIGRYGGSTTRSRIPIGSFYGHTTLLPWEHDPQSTNQTSVQHHLDKTQIMSQLGTFLSLQEDVHCRYSLASNRLTNLLSAVESGHVSAGMSQRPIRNKAKRSSAANEQDNAILQAYHDCVQLQLQLNLAQRAVGRLQRALDINPTPTQPANATDGLIIQQTGTDKLGTLSEMLLDTILTMTYPTPTIPHLPVSFYKLFTVQNCRALFGHLCVHGTRRMQLHMGVLLVRLCGNQPWWGRFLGSMLHEYFTLQHVHVFPQDRVFVLLTVLGQKSLTGQCANEVMESILQLLAKLLAPLWNQQSEQPAGGHASLDLPLVSWVLLFLSRCLDSTSDEADKLSKDKDQGSNNRWDFIQGENALQSSRVTSKLSSSKLYKRKLQRRLMHHKQQLLDLQQAKKNFVTSQVEKSASGNTKEVEAVLKLREKMFKKKLTQYSSKHYKDIIQIRRTDTEVLKKLPLGGASSSTDTPPGGGDEDHPDQSLIIVRERCVPVVKGLVALLLSMDFTCNVDLFLVACKVVAKLSNLTRPAISLCEIMSQTELDHLILLHCSFDYNHVNITWGGPWAGHAVISLLQDVLDGEKSFPVSNSSAMEVDMCGLTDDDLTLAESDKCLSNSISNSMALSTVNEEASFPSTPEPPEFVPSSSSKDSDFTYDTESELIIDMIFADEEFDDEGTSKLPEYISGMDYVMKAGNDFGPTLAQATAAVKATTPYPFNANQAMGKHPSELYNNWSIPPCISSFDSAEEKKSNFEGWKSKLAGTLSNSKSVPTTPGVSTAMDARLEGGIELAAELRVKVILALETDNLSNAITAALPSSTHHTSSSTYPGSDRFHPTDEQHYHTDNNTQSQLVSSKEMLSICFNHLFSMVGMHRVNLDVLLSTWLMLNDDMSSPDGFDCSKQPSITLSTTSVTCLLEVLASSPYVSVSTWVLSFQALSLLANISCERSSDSNSPDNQKWLAAVMVTDSNMKAVLLRFLTGATMGGSTMLAHQYMQIGPTATRAFHGFLNRLHLRCAEDNEQHLKKLLLNVVYTLSTDRGAFLYGLGPVDAQCRLLDFMLDMSYGTVQISDAISVTEAVATLVHQHIVGQERLTCQSSFETSLSARHCFGGLFSNILRTGDSKTLSGEATRDSLMLSLLKLLNLLIQIELPRQRPSTPQHRPHSDSVPTNSNAANDTPTLDSPITDSSKLSVVNLLYGGDMYSQLKSDEEKCSETDEQKTETAAHNSRASTSSVQPNSCSHYKDTQNPEAKPVTLSDMVLAHPHIIKHLLQSLATCNSNTMASIVSGSSIPGNICDSFTTIDPCSVGDGVFQILCTLNRKVTDLSLILTPILDYLRGGTGPTSMVSLLSEPLLWFILRVLDCESTLKIFLSMGGVRLVCENLVSSNRYAINVNPSLVSSITHLLSVAKGGVVAKKSHSDAESTDGLQNYAPLGSIMSSSPTAGPADILIQASPPHRRTRSAAWSYHFYPEEPWVDLTITLPSAILLKEVQVQPHLPSLATCPLAISLEVSCDGSLVVPVNCPVLTSGLTSIKMQLLKPEVVTSVTLRLHKPRDSTTIGLSQILLMGSTAFGDLSMARTADMFGPQDMSNINRNSISWLRLVHHCLSHCDAVFSEVAEATTTIPNLLVTCTALLVSPSATLYATNIETVLLKLGFHSEEMGLALIDNILRSTSARTVEGCLPLHGRVNGKASEYTVDILYELGVKRDPFTNTRIQALLQWLHDCAQVSIQQSNSLEQNSPLHATPHATPYTAGDNLVFPAPAHVHCIAAVLWNNRQMLQDDNCEVITDQMLNTFYTWSTVLPRESTIKKAVDYVLCSMCYIRSQFFAQILQWNSICVSPQQNSGLTDDSKEASSAAHLQQLSNLRIDHVHLSTLAIVCQSPEALQQLLNSRLPELLCQGLLEYCTEQNQFFTEWLMCAHDQSASDSGSQSASEPTISTNTTPSHTAGSTTGSATSTPNRTAPKSRASFTLTSDLVASVLRFLSEISSEPVMKDWLGGSEGNVFWSSLLHLLCNTTSQSLLAHDNQNKQLMSTNQRALIETATVELFSNVIACHKRNQHLFATVLCDVIRNQGTITPGSSNSVLSGFTRRLFLQVLLEDEKMLVNLHTSPPLFKIAPVLTNKLHHPCCGAGLEYRSVHVSLQSTCAQVINKVYMDSKSVLLSEDGEDRMTSDDNKDTNEMGIELVNQIAANVGLKAKEKRDKSQLPPRPPTRRGHRSSEAGTSAVNNPTDCLYHQLIPGVAMPGEMTLSQLLTLLNERGLADGASNINLTIKLKSKDAAKSEKRFKYDKGPNDWLDPDDTIITADYVPEEVLLSCTPMPSALQVFASVGGLALLAKHLPLLYPEITRQVTPPNLSHDLPHPVGVGLDWVNVEQAGDVYYEDPLEPSSTQPQPSHQHSHSLPSIPPHSLVAFGLFLRLPGYAEVLLKERKRAQCLLRLVLGVTDDGEGAHILTSPVASSLPTLPFNVLKTLFDCTPLTTDDGVLLRRMTLEIGAVHLVLACLSVLSHHAPRVPIPGFHQEIIVAATQAAASLAPTTTTTKQPTNTDVDKSQSYWAKGTGFGTGSTTSSWDAEQALLRQRSEEEHVTCLLQVLSSYIYPGSCMPENIEEYLQLDHDSDNNNLPAILPKLLSQSCLVPSICSYLRNDSVLDMARHVPLYRAVLELLRAIALCPVLVMLLLPLEGSDDSATSISSLLDKMKLCVDTYASRLKTNKGKTPTPSGTTSTVTSTTNPSTTGATVNGTGATVNGTAPNGTGASANNGKTTTDEDEAEGLALLIPDIQTTATICTHATAHQNNINRDQQASTSTAGSDAVNSHSQEEIYIATIKELQFDTFEMVSDVEGTLQFSLGHSYEAIVKAAGEINNPARARRLAQEAVTLSTSLPLSASSSVFVRCDDDRLDIMKVLITGPSDTPYANGCFEFDVYFPQNYPNSPPLINLETTGNHAIRFNPNLYNDGKVCLSILNTWHGRPEEKWNSQTSSFLQVLVSIQSLILVSEPYFNEPGYERSRGTPSGTASSWEYDANIRQATVKWAMLEQLRNPSPCFKEVVEQHFYLKQNEILRQIDDWIKDMETSNGDKRTSRSIVHSCIALKRHYAQLKEELNRLKGPGNDSDKGNPGPSTEPQTSTSKSPTETKPAPKSPNVIKTVMPAPEVPPTGNIPNGDAMLTDVYPPGSMHPHANGPSGSGPFYL